MTKTHRPVHANRSIATGLLAGVALLLGAACASSAESNPSQVSPSVADVEILYADETETATTAPTSAATELPQDLDEPVAHAPVPDLEGLIEREQDDELEALALPEQEPIPGTGLEPEPVVDPQSRPEQDPQPTPVDDPVSPNAEPSWEGACGPNLPVPSGSEYITQQSVDFAGDGLEGLATSYELGGQWFLRFDGPVVSDEMLIDAPVEGFVEVLGGASVTAWGNEEILVRTGRRDGVDTVRLFGNHDGCLFTYEDVFVVGIVDDVIRGVACGTDDNGSFLTQYSALPNEDMTYDIYGTRFVFGSPLTLDAGDGGHWLSVPTDDPWVGVLANVECDGVELG